MREVIDKILFLHAGRRFSCPTPKPSRNMRRSMRRICDEDDVIVEHIHEEAKTEEKENENGEKEIVEVSPARDQREDLTSARFP